MPRDVLSMSPPVPLKLSEALKLKPVPPLLRRAAIEESTAGLQRQCGVLEPLPRPRSTRFEHDYIGPGVVELLLFD